MIRQPASQIFFLTPMTDNIPQTSATIPYSSVTPTLSLVAPIDLLLKRDAIVYILKCTTTY